ncbi:ATP-binding protein [Desulfatirhabdium butyrativorans]|uniref:ATP-binding protein n=1 Tax=Desulfatirhabdium butyrativorans TaxID=340467 RepID=UPI0004116CCE|nr:ATP-binding protein [Desulfatirhabdium butyrativorans]
MSVLDEGQGIPETDLQHIFEPFYTTKVMGRSGTGLGLSVVWGTVKDHDGYIHVRSTPGQGTVFTLSASMQNRNVSKRLWSWGWWLPFKSLTA